MRLRRRKLKPQPPAVAAAKGGVAASFLGSHIARAAAAPARHISTSSDLVYGGRRFFSQADLDEAMRPVSAAWEWRRIREAEVGDFAPGSMWEARERLLAGESGLAQNRPGYFV
jgi:hypothetical protein